MEPNSQPNLKDQEEVSYTPPQSWGTDRTTVPEQSPQVNHPHQFSSTTPLPTSSETPEPISPQIKTESSFGRTFLVWLALILLGILLGVLASFFLPVFSLPFQNTPTVPNPTPTPTPTPSISLLGIQRITTEKYKINIPSDWKQPGGEGGTFQAPDGSSLSISVGETNSKQESLTDYLVELDSLQKTSWEGQPVKKVISSRNISIAGFPAVQRIEDWMAAGFTTINTYILVNQTIYSFFIIPSDLSYDKTDVFKEYNSVLDSFEPLDDYDCSKSTDPNCVPEI